MSESLVGTSADMFSLGLIILEMTANIILPENGPCWTQLREWNFTSIDFGTASIPLVDLIKSLLTPQPNQRPCALDILDHPLLKDWVEREYSSF